MRSHIEHAHNKKHHTNNILKRRRTTERTRSSTSRSDAMDSAADTPNEPLCAREGRGDSCCLLLPAALAIDALNSGSGTLTDSSSLSGAVTPSGPVAPPEDTYCDCSRYLVIVQEIVGILGAFFLCVGADSTFLRGLTCILCWLFVYGFSGELERSV